MSRRRNRTFILLDEDEGALTGNVFTKFALDWIFIAIILFAFYAPKKKDAEKPSLVQEVGALMIEAAWEPGPHDMDLWLTEPGSNKPIGFSNRAGKNCDLLRDDLGTTNDPLPNNQENIVCRVLPPGEYIVHVYYFNTNESGRMKPIDVTVVVSTWSKAFHIYEKRIIRTASLGKVKDTATVASFTVLPSGDIDNTSINDIPRELFNGNAKP